MNLAGANLLLALATSFPTLLAILTASLFGGPDGMIRNVLLAGICTAGFVLLNPMLGKAMKRELTPPIINPQARNAIVWAMAIPVIILLIAAIPVFRPGYDYGLIVIIASVLWGLTIESALKARKSGPGA